MIKPIVHGTGNQNEVVDTEARMNKDVRTAQYFNNPDSEDFQDIEKDILATGMSIPEFKKEWGRGLDSMGAEYSLGIRELVNPDADYHNMYDFKNSVWDDFSTHFQDGINRIGYGAGVVVPGLAAATQKDGESPEWVTDWIDEMGEWYDDTKERTSDASNQSFFETGSLRAFAGGLGSGAASMAPMVLSVIPYVGQGLYMATTFSDVFGATIKNGKDHGLSNEDAARMATIIAPIITASEYIGFKGIGRAMSKELAPKLIKGGYDAAIKKFIKGGMTKESLKEFVGVGMKDMSKKQFAKRKVGQIGKAYAHGAGSEGVTETAQSMIEQIAEHTFDATKDKDTKGHYGTKVGSKDFWMQSLEEGFYGAILGGTTSAVGSSAQGLKDQSVYHYARIANQKGKPENITALKNYVKKQVVSGQMDEKDYLKFEQKIDEVVDYEARMWHKLDSPSAKYQSYQALRTKDAVENIESSSFLEEQARDYPQKKSEMDTLLGSIRKGVEDVVSAVSTEDDLVTEETKKDKNKIFGKKNYKYNPKQVSEVAPELGQQVADLNKMLPEGLRIDPFGVKEMVNEGDLHQMKNGGLNPKADETQTQETQTTESTTEEASVDFGKQFKSESGAIITQSAIDSKDKIMSEFYPAYSEASNDENQEEKTRLVEELKSEYGVGLDAVNEMVNNPDMKGLTEVEAEQETIIEPKEEPKESIPLFHGTKEKGKKGKVLKVEKQYENVLEIEEDQLVHLQELSDKGDTVAQDILKSENKFSLADKYMDELYSEKHDAIKYKQESSEKPSEYYDTKDKKFYSTDEKYAKIAGSTANRSAKYSDGEIDAEYEAIKKKSAAPKKKTTPATPPKKQKTEPKKTETVKDKVVEPKAVTELTNDEIITELDSDITSEERVNELTQEQAKRNQDTTQGQLDILNDFESIPDFEQRKRSNASTNEDTLIKDNPELYEKIKGHFAKIFPNVPVKELNELGEKYGAKIMARIVEGGIEINKNEAMQSSLVHEYAHVYLEVLGENHPLVKLGYKMIEGTQFHKDAIELYPEKSHKEQLNEALTEALAQESLDTLKTKFEGSQLQKFKAFAKRFWNRIKGFFTNDKGKDIVSILSEGMTLKNKAYTVGVNSLVGMNQDQRKVVSNPKYGKLVDLVNSALIWQKLRSIADETKHFDHKSKKDLLLFVTSPLVTRYKAEKLNLAKGPKIFEGVNIDIAEDINNGNKIAEYQKFMRHLQENESDLFKYIDRVVNSMLKVNIEIDEDIVEEEASQDPDDKPSNDAVKASRKINSSVRAILSMLVNESGYKISPDEILSYVSELSQKSYLKSGMIKNLEKDSDKIIAKRILGAMRHLDDGQRMGFERTIKSLIQEVYEGTNLMTQKDEDGNITGWLLTNPIRNKDSDLGATKLNFEKWIGTDNYFQDMFDDRALNDIKNQKYDKINAALSKLYGTDIVITPEFVNSFKTDRNSGEMNFFNALGGQYSSFASYFKGQNTKGVEVEWKDINGYAEKIYQFAFDKTPVKANFLNGANNSVSSVQTGHYVSELNSLMMNEESGKMADMMTNPIYKGNTILDYFRKNKKVNYVVFDSQKNIDTNENADYSEQTKNDFHVNQLLKFATSTSNKHYKQSLGVMSNRDKVLLFEVPTYANKQELTNAYNEQARNLESLLQKKIKGLNDQQKSKVINDFNNLYIHEADANGNVTPGINKNFNNEVDTLKKILSDNALTSAFKQEKVGNGKKYATIDEMITDYVYTEALNRTYLNDIYGGIALHYSSPTSKKGAVEQAVKRLSGPTSNREIIELDKPVMLVVYKGGNHADSFNINGSALSERIKEQQGTLDKMGVNSKDQAYHIDAKSGKSVYMKRSSLNMMVNEDGTTNLDGMGKAYKDAADLIKKIEDINTVDGVKPYVMLMDDSALKGSYDNYTVHDYAKLKEQVNGDKPPKFTSVDLENYGTLFNLNKTLKEPSKQKTIFSTQAAVIQFLNSQGIDMHQAYDKIVSDHLKKNLVQSKTLEKLTNYDSTISEMTKDLEDRERTSTSDLLKAVEEYNNNPENTEKINVFDDPSLRLIYEQFVSSRLTKGGLKLEMSGNFMHQLPDLDTDNDTRLKGREVAVSYKMFGNTPSEAQAMLDKAKSEGKKLEVAVVRIPASAEMSMFAGEVKYFLDTDASVVTLSQEFVDNSDSDHDGDKAMVYRKEIKDDGTFHEHSTSTRLFKHFYGKLNESKFVHEAENNKLDPESLKTALEELGKDTGGAYSLSTVEDMVDIASKMKLGASAVGRFAIASKLMSYLSQSGESLHKGFMFGNEEMKAFTSDKINDLAVFLQAALDIGNDPILPLTGFDGTTIDVGNAMLLLGVGKEEIMEFLHKKPIRDMVTDFESKNLTLSDKDKISFNKYFSDTYLKDGKDKISLAQIKDTHGDDIASYAQFKRISDDLTKIIAYVQLDKSLPNNAEKASSLLESLSEFKTLSFSLENFLARESNKYRENLLRSQDQVYKKNLLTADRKISDVIDTVSKNLSNAFEFKKRAKEQLMMSVAQRQIETNRKDVQSFIYGLSDRVSKIYDYVVLDKKGVEASSMIERITSRETEQEMNDEIIRYASVVGEERVSRELREYNEQMDSLSQIDKYADNQMFKYIEFKPKEKGSSEILMRLSPKFKATEESMAEFKEGFKELQEVDPQLAQEIIDYQLYRFGTNNKIGSFIDGLPSSVSLNGLVDASILKRDIQNFTQTQEQDVVLDEETGIVTEVESKFKDNIEKHEQRITENFYLANQDLMTEITEKEYEKGKLDDGSISVKGRGAYFTYGGSIYKHAGSDIYSKVDGIQNDSNFTAYNTGRFNENVVSESDIDKQINGCK